MRISIVALFVFSALIVTSSAEIYQVPGDAATIQAAINMSEDGDIIEILNGTYSGPGNVDLSYNGKAITVRSESGNAGSCIIDCGVGGEPCRGFRFDSGETADSVLENITITGGEAQAGGAINIDGHYNDPVPTITGCRFIDNEAVYGGAIYIVDYGPSAFITNCLFEQNRSGYGGGGAVNLDCAWPTFSNCRFIQNQADGGGGAVSMIDVFNGPEFHNCVFAGNSATDGGAIRILEGSPQFTTCYFTGNSAGSNGGALSGGGGVVSPHFTSCTLAGNQTSGSGGAIYLSFDGSTEFDNVILWSNCADSEGDEVYLDHSGQTCQFECCDVDPAKVTGSGSFDFLDGNINTDPLFCESVSCDEAPTTAGWYELDELSPCAAAPDCGLIGAGDIGCDGGSLVAPASWGQIKLTYK